MALLRKKDSFIFYATCPFQGSCGFTSLNLMTDKSRQHIKKQRYHFADKGPYSQSYGFSGSHVQMCWIIRVNVEELMILNCGAGEDS